MEPTCTPPGERTALGELRSSMPRDEARRGEPGLETSSASAGAEPDRPYRAPYSPWMESISRVSTTLIFWNLPSFSFFIPMRPMVSALNVSDNSLFAMPAIILS